MGLEGFCGLLLITAGPATVLYLAVIARKSFLVLLTFARFCLNLLYLCSRLDDRTVDKPDVIAVSSIGCLSSCSSLAWLEVCWPLRFLKTLKFQKTLGYLFHASYQYERDLPLPPFLVSTCVR